MEFLLREARGEDVDEMVRLRARLFVDMAARGSAARPDQAAATGWEVDAARLIRAELGDPAHHYEVAVRPEHGPGQGVIAWGRATLVAQLPGPGFPTGRSGLINSLVTAPEARGRGAGSAVAQALLRWLDASGAEVVDLLASRDSASLFRRLGFAEPASTALRWQRPTP